MDRAMKRFGKKGASGEDFDAAKAKGEAKAPPHAKPGMKDTEIEMEPNAVGAEAVSSSNHGEMTARHAEELTAMQGRHAQEMKDMHGRHMSEMQQMHGRHATEIGGKDTAGAKAEEGAKTPSAKKLAGKGWKTRDKGKGGTEPKGG